VVLRRIVQGVGILIVGLCVAAFPAMEWIRAQQGHSELVHPSEIESLAIHPQSTDPLADARSRGQLVYQHYCAICHGAEGKGDGLNASLLEVSPRDFTNPQFWEKNTTPERLHDVITHGGTYVGKSILMPVWGNTLTENQVRDVIVYIRAFPDSAKTGDE